MSGGRKKTILVFALVLVALAVTLAVLSATVWKTEPGGEEAQTELLVPEWTIDQIDSISVRNRNFSYRLYRASDGELYFDGAEYVLYQQNRIAFLRSVCAHLSVLGEVEDARDLSEYALTEELCSASFTVTSVSGESYRVLVGAKLVSGEGYYARLDGGDRIVVLPVSLENCLFSDLNFFLSPQVAINLSESDYYTVDRMAISRLGEKYMEIEKIPEDEVKESDLSTHRISFPAPYEPNTALFTQIFHSFTAFSGKSVCAYGLSRMDADEYLAVMRRYHLVSENDAQMICKVEYTYHDFTTELYFGAPEDETGLRYVFSPDFDIVASFDASSLAWADYDLMDYTQSELFARPISDVKQISIKARGVDAAFDLEHGENAKELVVRAGQTVLDTQDFRQFYTQILYLKNAGYATVPASLASYDKTELTITLNDGSVFDYCFYDIATRQSYYTISGKGVFYVNRDYTKKLVSDAVNLTTGKAVVARQFS